MELVRRAGGVDRRAGDRARIVLAAAEGLSNVEVAAAVGVSLRTVGRWRRGFAARRLAGLSDAAPSGRSKATELVLAEAERVQLERWARRAKTAQFLALRARIVLRCAEGGTDRGVAGELGVNESTVLRWRTRFTERRLDGLFDEPRAGRPPSVPLDQVKDVIAATLESAPGADTQWSRTSMAKRTGLSPSTIGRIWKRLDLKPHLRDSVTLTTDPRFVAKVVDVVGLYHNPPEKAVVLCVEEESLAQALDRSQPVVPMMPGMPERRTHDYLFRAITRLFAADNIADGAVVGELHRRHRAIEFRRFLTRIDRTVPTGLDVHLVCENNSTYNTAEIRTWLERHPRFHVHVAPTGSAWLHQVERWFGRLADELVRRGVHTSVHALEADIRVWIHTWNRNPRPFAWTRTADEILASLSTYLTTITPPADTTNKEEPAPRTCGAGRRAVSGRSCW
ncbi:IS630 family transposase [Frankia sp. AgB32]|nr:IS630 family transposase [Frankia sp. AgB32]MCK9893964.1 IS630 family transposase [Frankia sp. AgB32]